MKRKLTILCSLILSSWVSTNAQNLHMVNGNASDFGFDFNATTGVVSNLFFTFGEDDGFAVNDDFTISWGVQSDINDFGTYVEVDRVTFTAGISAYSSYVINSWGSQNLNDNWDIEDGDYYLVGIIDTDDDISETNENAADNGMLLASDPSGKISFIAATSNGIKTTNKDLSEVKSFPNPFTDNTQIEINVEQSSPVEILVKDVNGKLINTINRKQLNPGKHIFQLNGENLESGIYFYSVKTNNGITTNKLIKK